jgi:hypothetical protein
METTSLHGYRKKSFAEATSLLKQLRFSTTRTQALNALKALQLLLIKEVKHCEVKIRQLERKLDLQGSGSSDEVSPQRRIAGYRLLNNTWKSFGDAIAYSLGDKYSLKQLYYNTFNTNPKQNAGFISDKSGFYAEVKVLDDFLNRGIPCVLCDLTNTIRHGDVCVYVGNEPTLIEVKSSKKTDQRGRKQLAAIQSLHSFLANDFTKQLRGYAELRRSAPRKKEKLYFAEFNQCLARAMKDGNSLVSPEVGLWYLALKDNNNLKAKLQEINGTQLVIHSWNELKTNMAWPPYYPYTLSIESPDALFSFVRGELYICVVYDRAVMKSHAKKLGFIAEFEPFESEYGLSFYEHNGKTLYSRTSSQMLARIAYDLTSPKWLIQTSVELPQKYGAHLLK